MRAEVDGVVVAFDVRSPQLVPSDLGWDERPVAVLVGDALVRDALAAALEPAAQVVTVEARDGAADAATHAGDLHGLLDALEVERPVLLGVGAGAAVALAFVERWPGRAARAALVVEEDAAPALGAVPESVLVVAPGDPSAAARLAQFVRG